MSLHHPGTEILAAEGFILAGGRSSRMGRDKALVDLAGNPLIQHALSILRFLGARTSHRRRNERSLRVRSHLARRSITD